MSISISNSIHIHIHIHIPFPRPLYPVIGTKFSSFPFPRVRGIKDYRSRAPPTTDVIASVLHVAQNTYYKQIVPFVQRRTDIAKHPYSIVIIDTTSSLEPAHTLTHTHPPSQSVAVTFTFTFTVIFTVIFTVTVTSLQC